MARKTDIELARAAIAKATRAEVRLRYSIMADAEIDRLLSDRLTRFDSAVQHGFVPAVSLTLIEDGDEAV